MSTRDLILVTGGGGFLGRYIVRELQAGQQSVRVFGRSDQPDLRGRGVDVQCGDIRDPEAIRSACRGVSGVIHTAGIAGVGPHRKPYLETNWTGTRNLLVACKENAVRRLVFTSSPSVVAAWGGVTDGTESLGYPRRYPAAYPLSKALAEKEVLQAAGNPFATCALRPHLIWGRGDRHLIPRIVDRAKRGRLLRIGNGRNCVSITHVKNAAQAHVQALQALRPDSPLNGQVYFIADAEAVFLWEWINDLLLAVGLPPTTRSLSLPAAQAIGAVLDMGRRLAPCLAEAGLSRFLALQLGTSHCFSYQRAQADFGYTPTVDNAHAKKELIEWLRASMAPHGMLPSL